MYATHKQVVVFQLWNPCEAGKNFKIYPQNSNRGMRSFHFIVSESQMRTGTDNDVLLCLSYKKTKD